MRKTDRRAFLKLSALAASSAATGSLQRAHHRPRWPRLRCKAWRTAGRQRFQPIEPPSWQSQVASCRPCPFVSTRIQRRQAGARLWRGPHGRLLLPAPAAGSHAKRAALLEECFGDSGLRFSVARTTHRLQRLLPQLPTATTTRQSPIRSLTHFSIAHDRTYDPPAAPRRPPGQSRTSTISPRPGARPAG
jgi:hypothetical protein